MSQVVTVADYAQKRAGAAARAGRVRVKSIALPAEHGGWGMLFEPVTLGLLVAPSWPGLLLAIASLGAFLARQPLKIVAVDRKRGRRFPRTPVAERLAVLYGGVAALGLLAAIKTAASVEFLMPLMLVAPLGIVQLTYDARGRSRELTPEMTGSIAVASMASVIALAGGWPYLSAFGLWLIITLRVVPTILFVRTRLRQLHGETVNAVPATLAHTVAAGLALISAWVQLIPEITVVAFLILWLRATCGFSERGVVTAKRIGIREIFYGAMTVFACVLGYYL